ncbi:MAG: M50 family metallopeptidase [Proteobacteria bacterium]|nr:M50 family metallopeptidase [Pseudomonadota bacterium]
MSQSSEVPAKLTQSDKRILACVGLSAVVIALYFIPYGWYVLYPFMLVYTFIHEMGHGIAALMMGGEFVKFEMWVRGSGMATFTLPIDASRFAKAFVAFGGLVAPAIMAAVCMVLARSGKAARVGLYIFTGICALSLILVVRNLFGIVFVLLCGLATFALAKLPKKNTIPQYSTLFLALTLLTAVFARGDYLFTAVAHTDVGDAPSDVAQIQDNLFLPYWFWGGLIAIISVAILILGIRAFFRAPAKSESGTKSKAIQE